MIFVTQLKLTKEAQNLNRLNYGVINPNYAAGLNNIATAYKSLGYIDSALLCIDSCLFINKTLFGEMHDSYALGLSNKAVLLGEKGDLIGKKKCLEQALLITKEINGENSMNYALHLNGISLLYADMGDIKKAVELNKRGTRYTRFISG